MQRWAGSPGPAPGGGGDGARGAALGGPCAQRGARGGGPPAAAAPRFPAGPGTFGVLIFPRGVSKIPLGPVGVACVSGQGFK